MTFQDLIFELFAVLGRAGCLLQQPLDLEVGAGTMIRETFLRCARSQHWNVAYVQPSRRPADGTLRRESDASLQHHQFQVILKPAPDEVQYLYLQSLEACGSTLALTTSGSRRTTAMSPTLSARPGIGWQVLFERHGDHAVHVLPAGRRHGTVADCRGHVCA